ncbi:MAG: hypothetical protein FWG93_05130 [Oscillospiraceae bacterium]|nr:hypothetical protein [Oscillospiraceae bacterium]
MPLHVAAELNNGNHQLETALTYTDALGETKTVETAVYIYISRPEPPPTPPPTTPPSPDASIPRVIISHHSVSEPVVTAGGPFELHFTLTNTSRVKDIKNMKVTVTDEQGIFLPVAGVNSFYVEELGIGGLVSLSIHLTPKQDAESKSYPVTLSLAYEDRENAQYNVSESLSIPVYQPQRLEVSNLLFFGDGMGGAQLNFQFINKGKSTLYNMTVRVEGPMALMEGDYFVGNFPAGAMDYFEDALLIESYGEVSGWLVMQYEDAAGAALEYRQELSAWIDGGFDPGPWDPGPWEPAPWPDPEPGEGEGGTILGLAPWLFWTLLGVVLALAAGTVVTVVLVSKKRRAKEMMEDDE